MNKIAICASVIFCGSCMQPHGANFMTDCIPTSEELLIVGTMKFGFFDSINTKNPNNSFYFIRSQFIQDNIDGLRGKKVKVIAEPVRACEFRLGSTELACINLGEDGIAYKIRTFCYIR